jgi:ketopantoate reductase
LLETAEQLGLDLPNNRVITALMRARQAAPAFWQGQPTD